MTILPLLLAMTAMLLASALPPRLRGLRAGPATTGAAKPTMPTPVAPARATLWRRSDGAGEGGTPRDPCCRAAALGPIIERAALGPIIERAIAAALRSARPLPPPDCNWESCRNCGLAAVLGGAKPGLRHWQVDAALRRRVLAADGDALEAALTALLRRAVAHSRDGDIIALRWVEATDTVAIVVEDEGDGLPGLGAELDETGMVTSLGIGLHHARSLAAAQGGDVRLEAAPGIGARAWLTLPRARVLEVN